MKSIRRLANIGGQLTILRQSGQLRVTGTIQHNHIYHWYVFALFQTTRLETSRYSSLTHLAANLGLLIFSAVTDYLWPVQIFIRYLLHVSYPFFYS